MLSREAMRAAILKEEEEKKKINIEFSQTSVLDVWEKYVRNLSSKSTQAALKNDNIIIEIHGRTIKIFTPTLYVKDVILQESKLMDEMRSYFHKDDLIMQVEVDKIKFPNYEEVSVTKVKLSNQEIYKSMVGKNPVLKDFIDVLELKVE